MEPVLLADVLFPRINVMVVLTGLMRILTRIAFL